MSTTIRKAVRALISARGRAALSLGVVFTIGVTGTFAYWTDSVTIAGTTFTAGSIDLKVNGSDTPPTYTALNIGTMVPGNSTAAVLTVTNSGTSSLKYTVTTTASNLDGKGLAAALVVKVTNDAATGTSSSGQPICAGTALLGVGTSFGGSLISTGRLLTQVSVPATATEKLCVQVTLPSSVTDTNLQGATTNVGFTFTGTSDLS